MRNMKFTILLLGALLALLPVAALARVTSESASLGNRATTGFTTAPIGSASSLDMIEINGTTAGRQGLLWNGDIIQAAPGAAVQVSLAAAGQLTLRGGAAVRLAADATSRVLLATVINGEVNVALKPDFAAKLELAGTGYVTTKGAQFRASLREGQPSLLTTSGAAMQVGNFALGLYDKDSATAVAAQQQAGPRKYLIKPLNLGTNTEIRARATRNLQVRVTDENDRPVPDAVVLFFLNGGSGGSGGAGSLAGQATVRATTNSQGVAQTNFTAGNSSGTSTRIKVQVEGSEAVWEGTLSIIAARAGFWSPQNSVPIFGVLGAAVGVGIYKITTRDTVPPAPQVTPRSGTTVILP